MDALNTVQVFDWLWTSGQLSEADVQQLPGLGIDLVINLALPTSPNVLENEGSLVTGLGMAYVHIPVVWEQPRVEQFGQFVGVMRAFKGKRIWVHCAKNMRVSAFITLYRRLVLGEGEEEASYPMNTIWKPDDTWKQFMDDVYRKYAA